MTQHTYHRPSLPLSDVITSDGVPRPRIAETAYRFDHDDRIARDLEREADRLLLAAGDLDRWHLSPAGSESLHRVDVIDRYTRRPFVAGDRMAFRGVARWQPVSVRYGKVATTTVTPVWTVAADGTCVPPHTLIELWTTAAGRGYAWQGHRRVALKHANVRRAGSVKRGRGRPPVSVWAANDGSIRRRWAKATSEQQQAAAALRARLVEHGSLIVHGVRVSVTPTPRQRVIVQTGVNLDRVAEGSFTLDDYVRRAVLA